MILNTLSFSLCELVTLCLCLQLSRRVRESAASPSRLQRLQRRLLHPSRWLVPLKEDKWPHLNSAVSTTEETCLSASSTVLRTGSSGRSTSCPWTTTTTCQSSSRASARNRTLTDSSPCRASSTCSRRVVQRCSPLSLNLSFPSKVSYNFQTNPL